MYESIVVIIRGIKYILTYNVNAMCPDELSEILNFDDALETWSDTLITNFDSNISEYDEMIIKD